MTHTRPKTQTHNEPTAHPKDVVCRHSLLATLSHCVARHVAVASSRRERRGCEAPCWRRKSQPPLGGHVRDASRGRRKLASARVEVPMLLLGAPCETKEFNSKGNCAKLDLSTEAPRAMGAASGGLGWPRQFPHSRPHEALPRVHCAATLQNASTKLEVPPSISKKSPWVVWGAGSDLDEHRVWTNIGFGRTSAQVEARIWANIGLGRTSESSNNFLPPPPPNTEIPRDRTASGPRNSTIPSDDTPSHANPKHRRRDARIPIAEAEVQRAHPHEEEVRKVVPREVLAGVAVVRRLGWDCTTPLEQQMPGKMPDMLFVGGCAQTQPADTHQQHRRSTSSTQTCSRLS